MVPMQQKGEESRQRVLDAAIREFGHYGYRGASTNRICAESGLSKGLLFHYYKSKDRLFLAALERCADEFKQAIDRFSLEQACSVELLAQFHRYYIDYFAAHPDHYRVISLLFSDEIQPDSTWLSERRAAFERERSLALRLFLNRCVLKQEVDREAAYELLSLALEHIQQKYIADLRRPDSQRSVVLAAMESEVKQLVSMVFYGILETEPQR